MAVCLPVGGNFEKSDGRAKEYGRGQCTLDEGR